MRASPRTIALAVLLTPVGACVDYLNHRDSLTLAAGDGMHANAATQTIDPDPPVSRKKTIDYDGRYIAATIAKYPALSQPGGGAQTNPCQSPDDVAADGSRCGGRASSVKPGGLP